MVITLKQARMLRPDQRPATFFCDVRSVFEPIRKMVNSMWLGPRSTLNACRLISSVRELGQWLTSSTSNGMVRCDALLRGRLLRRFVRCRQ